MKKKHLPGKILLSLLCALALTHIAAAFMLKASPVKLAFVLAAVGFAASLVLRLRVPKAARAFTIAVTALFIAAGAALAAVLAGYSASAVYAGGDDGKANLFAGKRVLLVVPHQDDELNLMWRDRRISALRQRGIRDVRHERRQQSARGAAPE